MDRFLWSCVGLIGIGIMMMAAGGAFDSTPKSRFLTIEEQRQWHVETCIDRIKEQPDARVLCERIVQLKKGQFN